VKKIKRIAVARFHGIDPAQSPLYAMGQDQPGVFTPKQSPEKESVSIPEVRTKKVLTQEEVATLQRRLKLLCLVGWLKSDVGKIDGKAGRKTTAAVIEFQRAQGLRPDGKAGPLTLARLESVFRSACDAPQAKKYLNPNRPSGLVFSSTDWQEGAQLYFRHGAARSGESVTLILCGEDLPQKALQVQLLSASTGKPLHGQEYALQVEGVRSTVEIPLSSQLAGAVLHAKLVSFAVMSEAPLRVV
jgi:peptidoglycan hydrolase-like protein with peptidoglycan-binding domain